MCDLPTVTQLVRGRDRLKEIFLDTCTKSTVSVKSFLKIDFHIVIPV